MTGGHCVPLGTVLNGSLPVITASVWWPDEEMVSKALPRHMLGRKSEAQDFLGHPPSS